MISRQSNAWSRQGWKGLSLMLAAALLLCSAAVTAGFAQDGPAADEVIESAPATAPVLTPAEPAATPEIEAPVSQEAPTPLVESADEPVSTVDETGTASPDEPLLEDGEVDVVPSTALQPESDVLSPVEPADAGMPMVEHGLDHDLSPWGMFMMADIVVKAVMIGLAAAALVTWIIWLGKWLQLTGARGRARRALRAVAQAESLEAAMTTLEKRKGVGVLLVQAADEEMSASADLVGRISPSGIRERVSSRLSRIEAAAGRKMSQGTGILASIGSVAPFVGLFGTVWGIMNSFVSIAETQTTNLAVVAPGIAEALLATAIGLVAAIPAVIIYNAFARSITGYRQLLADVSAGIERLVSRDLDRLSLAISPTPQPQAAE